MKELVRDKASDALAALGVLNIRVKRPGTWLIVTFHRVLPERLRSEYSLPGLVVTPDELAWILNTLTPHFEVLTVSDAYRKLHGSADSRSLKPLLSITFDDGQLDNLHYAIPVLNERGIKATFYLPSAYIGSERYLWHDAAGFAWQDAAESVGLERIGHFLQSNGVENGPNSGSVRSFITGLKQLPPQKVTEIIGKLTDLSALEREHAERSWAGMMNWQQCGDVLAMGHEIGSHSKTHACLPQLSSDEQFEEIMYSHEEISRNLGIMVESFCYPNGDYDNDSLTHLRAGGYLNAVTTRWGLNKSAQPRYELLRCDMNIQHLRDRTGQLSKGRLFTRISGFIR